MIAETIIKLALSTISKRKWNRFISESQQLGQTQEGFLLKLLQRHADTEIGRKYHFSNLSTAREYMQRVPIHSWDTISPYIDRIAKGEKNILTPGPSPIFLGRTTGTTDKPKLIPITEEDSLNRSHNRKLLAYSVFRKHPDAFSGKWLSIVNPAIAGHTQAGIPYGAYSGRSLERERNSLTNKILPYPPAALYIEDIHSRDYTMMRLSIPQNISLIIDANPAIIRDLFKLVDEHKEKIIKDIFDGTITANDNSHTKIIQTLSKSLKPNKTAAKKLERIVAETGFLQPKNYWPNLKTILCWTGGTVGLSAKELKTYCPKATAIHDLGYMATEGNFTIPVNDFDSSGLLTAQNVFFEFIAKNDLGKPNAKPLMAHEIEPNVSYQILITTAAGLYRYQMNDIVELSGYYKDIPLIRFLNKGSDVTDLAGEKVTGNQVLLAMEAVCKKIPLEINHFMYVANAKKSEYTLSIEFYGKIPNHQTINAILVHFNQKMIETNTLFARYLKRGNITSCNLNVMTKGWLNELKNQKISEHGFSFNSSQYKPKIIDTQLAAKEMVQTHFHFERYL